MVILAQHLVFGLVVRGLYKDKIIKHNTHVRIRTNFVKHINQHVIHIWMTFILLYIKIYSM